MLGAKIVHCEIHACSQASKHPSKQPTYNKIIHIQRTLICPMVLIHICAPINAFNVTRMKMIRLKFASFSFRFVYFFCNYSHYLNVGTKTQWNESRLHFSKEFWRKEHGKEKKVVGFFLKLFVDSLKGFDEEIESKWFKERILNKYKLKIALQMDYIVR